MDGNSGRLAVGNGGGSGGSGGNHASAGTAGRNNSTNGGGVNTPLRNNTTASGGRARANLPSLAQFANVFAVDVDVVRPIHVEGYQINGDPSKRYDVSARHKPA